MNLLKSRRYPHCTLVALALGLALFLPACGGFGSSSRRSTGPGHSGSSSGQSSASSSQSRGAPAQSGDRVAMESSSRSSATGGQAYDSQPEPRETVDDSRPGLGTEFGESRYSAVSRRRFERAHESPFATVALHYNDDEGIRQQAWFRGIELHELRAQTQHGGISISLLDENGRLLQGGTAAGQTYVIGQDGQRYMISIRNDTGGTYEVVTSVDGLDVIDGRPATKGKRGYIVAPYSTLTIDGFRTSDNSVAAFRFGAVRDSYAARTSGDRNVGVIGLAFFAERGSPWTTDEIRRRETADPFPGDYAQPPAMIR